MLLHDIYHGAVADTYFDAFEPVNDEFMDLLLQLKRCLKISLLRFFYKFLCDYLFHIFLWPSKIKLIIFLKKQTFL